MRKGRLMDEQIIKVLKEHAAGMSASDLCRKHGISDATFCQFSPSVRYRDRGVKGAFQSVEYTILGVLSPNDRYLATTLADKRDGG